jgi:subtilisin family serine protease
MDAEFFAPWTRGAFGANLADGTNSAEEAGMPAKGRVRRLTILLAVAALLVTAPGPTAGAGAQGAAASRGTRPGQERPVAITLLTGDKVLLRQRSGRQAVQVVPARRPGARRGFQVVSVHGDLHVIPGDVHHLVGRLLDLDLFNVSALERMGYTDTRAPSLPLIVQRRTARRPPALAAASLRPVRELASLRATAVRQPRTAAAKLGAALAGTGTVGSRTTGRLAGVTQVWLDRRFRATDLDSNLTQIGAPAAWSAGLTGRGVKVAVLDTGIDTTHPDLRGKVLAAADFAGSGSTTDRAGHGTHVASIVAGTGVRSGGERKGVAFEASLLNGKVLDDFGFGSESGIIAGMEWAAAQRARVVNMSLGGWPTDGSDPMSLAVDRLTARYRTLFVISAGNSGPGEQTVENPGVSLSALTVGAVDVADELADFSSRGPRFGDYAMKPDITAPGVDIVAARAAGTDLGEPVDQWYTRLSGTSMAAPHVAGAAAIMAQRWPAWTPARIKAVLMGTANPDPELGVYSQGGGRLDVGHAIAQRLIARRANVDFGFFRYPQTGLEPVTKSLPLLNLGDAGTTVDLRLELEGEDGGPAPAGMATVTPSRLTLATGAEASAQVTVDVQAGAPGLYGGAVVATPATGPAVRVPIGFFKEPERYDLTLNAVGRDGQPATFADAGVMNVDDGELFADFLFFDEDASLTIRVAPGSYHIMGNVVGGNFDTVSMVGDPEVEVTGPTTFTLDARRAEPVTQGIEGVATDPNFVDLGYTRLDATGNYGLASSFTVGQELAENGLFAEPTDPVSTGQFEVELRTRLLPAGSGSPATAATLYDLLLYGGRVPDPPSWVLPAAERARLARATGHYRALNDNADYQDVRVGFAPLQFAAGGGYESVAVPRTRVEYLSPAPIFWIHDGIRYGGQAFIDFLGPWRDYQPGERTDEWWFGAPLHAMGYGDRGADWMFVGVADLRDTGGHNGYPWEWSEEPVATQAFRLYRNGRLLASAAREPFLQVAVPATRASYRVERDLNLRGLTRLANVSRTRWWFISAAPAGQDPYALLPLLAVDYQAAQLGGRNGAVAGRPVTIDLRVARQEGAPASEVAATRLWSSTDDGATWREVGLKRTGAGHYRAVLQGSSLRSGTYVSLRTWARDASNSRIDQTLVRAFPVR